MFWYFLLETGGPLHLSVVWTNSNMVNVSCGSEGWFPKPYLRWSDQEDRTQESVRYTEDSLGLLSVHSWVLVPYSSDIICTVGLQGIEEKESRLHLSDWNKLPQNGIRVIYLFMFHSNSYQSFVFRIYNSLVGGLGCSLDHHSHRTWNSLLQIPNTKKR